MSIPPGRSDSVRSNIAEYSVSEISFAIKRTVEDRFERVRVRGEVSGYRGPHSSGHAYFTLKDDKARIDAVIWRGAFSKLAFKPEEGLEVIATGKLTTYPGSSKYQIVIDNIEPAGAGALMALLEERRRKLAAEGLFDTSRKQLLPYLPRVIGVVTSPTGAVIRDIMHRINDRFPLHVIVWPVRVQGETSATEVAAAIEGFNAFDGSGGLPKPDILIVARGGGSLEDLWGFNEEIVVRAAANSMIPLISAVGHETDWTLIDNAADARAPTPTGAAEIAIPVKAELQALTAQLGARLGSGIGRLADRKREALRAARRGMPAPDGLLAMPRQRFDAAEFRLGHGLKAGVTARRNAYGLLANRLSPNCLTALLDRDRSAFRQQARDLPRALENVVSRKREALSSRASRLSIAGVERQSRNAGERLSMLSSRLIRAIENRLVTVRGGLEQKERLLKSLSYEAVLERGFALVRDEAGVPLKRAADVKKGSALVIEFAGRQTIDVVATEHGKKPANRTSGPRKPPQQGDLF
ncbi:exodeoxyribonuclease VII large subunit [Oricola cellulosilytica]|uniref:Exodeoxyribonuclease 7 large subunit n=1 Tax=Oricola cellulosilytica TaxID=1429082 RepID=A0A4R0PJM3_9HYPH|nr:exodeoxyribonuclease VII large subunit [Oricola cellulosilytica]TCD16764.1 exodeoxyribonuclease VII large subunit [Oricola cellulosilytica]